MGQAGCRAAGAVQEKQGQSRVSGVSKVTGAVQGQCRGSAGQQGPVCAMCPWAGPATRGRWWVAQGAGAMPAQRQCQLPPPPLSSSRPRGGEGLPHGQAASATRARTLGWGGTAVCTCLLQAGGLTCVVAPLGGEHLRRQDLAGHHPPQQAGRAQDVVDANPLQRAARVRALAFNNS